MPLTHPLRHIQLRSRLPSRPRLRPHNIPHALETLRIMLPYPTPLPLHRLGLQSPDLPPKYRASHFWLQDLHDALVYGDLLVPGEEMQEGAGVDKVDFPFNFAQSAIGLEDVRGEHCRF